MLRKTVSSEILKSLLWTRILVVYFFQFFFWGGWSQKLLPLRLCWCALEDLPTPHSFLTVSERPVNGLYVLWICTTELFFSCIYLEWHAPNEQMLCIVKVFKDQLVNFGQARISSSDACPGRYCLSCPSTGPSEWISLCSEDQRHSWVCKASTWPSLDPLLPFGHCSRLPFTSFSCVLFSVWNALLCLIHALMDSLARNSWQRVLFFVT